MAEADVQASDPTTTTTTVAATTTTAATVVDTSWIGGFLADVRVRADEALGSGDPEVIRLELEEYVGSHGLTQQEAAQINGEDRRTYDAIRAELERGVELTARFDQVDRALTGPALEPDEFGALPQEVFAVQLGDAVVLVGSGGDVLGHVRGADLFDAGLHERLDLVWQQRGYLSEDRADLDPYQLVDDQLEVRGEAVYSVGDDEMVERSADGRFLTRLRWDSPTDTVVYDRVDETLTELPDGCAVSREFDSEWYLICALDDLEDGALAGARVRRRDGSIERLSGPAYGPYDFREGRIDVPGHWLWLSPGPNGDVLAQWSGECEVLSGHLIIDGEAYGLAQSGDDIELASRLDFNDPELFGMESWAVGWLASGEAVIGATSGPCSQEIEGLYAIAPNGTIRLIYEPSGRAVLLHQETE